MNKRIYIKEFLILFNAMVEENKKTNDPIPELSKDNLGKIESCLNMPFMDFDGNALYPTVYDKAAILFYTLIKNHPLKNGNKRMAYATMYYFLSRNGINLKLSNDEVYKFTKRVAISDSNKKDYYMRYIKKTING